MNRLSICHLTSSSPVSRPNLRPTQSLMQWIPWGGTSLRGKRPVCLTTNPNRVPRLKINGPVIVQDHTPSGLTLGKNYLYQTNHVS